MIKSSQVESSQVKLPPLRPCPTGTQRHSGGSNAGSVHRAFQIDRWDLSSLPTERPYRTVSRWRWKTKRTKRFPAARRSVSEMTGIVNPWPCSTRYRSTAITGAAISFSLLSLSSPRLGGRVPLRPRCTWAWGGVARRQYATQSRKRARTRGLGRQDGLPVPDCWDPGWLSLGNGRGGGWGSAHKIGFARASKFGRRRGGRLGLARRSGARLRVPGWLSRRNGPREPLRKRTQG